MTTKIKKQKRKSTAIVQTYDERASKSTRTAMGKLIDGGVADYDSGIEEIKSGVKAWVRGCNKIREAGRKFTEAEALGQKEFKGWHVDEESWRQDAVRRAKIEAAKKVFRLMEKPATTFDDCKPAIQIALIASGDLAQPKRLEAHTSHEPPNPWNEMVEKISLFESISGALEKDRPMNEWDDDELEKFVHVTKPVADKCHAAELLLRDKNRG
jgi:hypothetical protein